ncbi:NitT/TauT family transport system ATP-binding protein [Palleronia salina]|uniref:NitT/TauT family transport system ATP-binding protein n=1 Tax=Palleronia salina TaxID=313368 RepID=A0A1M6HX19_9RHOB|nr:NitT/TauT family transport system ATP-binding protein [Palleronia salina]
MSATVTQLRPGGSDRPVLHIRINGLQLDGRPVLGAMELRVKRGETVALVGPSGIGKTTLLRAVAGLQRGAEGHIDAPARTAMIFQEPTLLPWRTLTDNLRVTTGIDAGAADRLLAEIGLGGRGDAFPGQLSLGQQRRMALARAFATRPELLLMDEPFVSLDPGLVDEMMGLFLRLRAETQATTLFVTHVRDEAARLASRIVTLGGPPATVVNDAPNRAGPKGVGYC